MLAWVPQTFADIFLTSDPLCYDASGGNAECPYGFEYSADAGTTWNHLGGEIAGTQIVVMHEVTVLAHGTHVWDIRSINAWGESDSVPFAFTAGVPVGPSGLRLIAP